MDVLQEIKNLVGGLLEMSAPVPEGVPLLDLGADSLVLIELSARVEENLGVEISVQQLFEDIVTVDAIARWVEQQRAESPPAAGPVLTSPVVEKIPAAPTHSRAPSSPAARGDEEKEGEAIRPAANFREATAESRRMSEAYQGVLCNNRRIAERDEAVRATSYPVWVTKSDGAHLWDVDGNRLVDIAMGYGSHLFGHNPPFLVRALHEQIDQGVHLGGEVAGSGELAVKVRQLTGMDRVNFCVTGTEAVFTAMRLARAFTGRAKVVILNGHYHGHSDATMYGVKPGARSERTAAPSVPGVSAAGGGDVFVASADDDGLVDFLTERGEEIAAVLMSPLNNQFPDQDLAGLAADMREVTRSIGALLVFDEVLTGFRLAPGGAQELFGVTADIATYGKTVAGGLPVAVVAGRAEIMDLVDGGPWTEDLRAPAGRTTYTGGTYVKHPLSMAAANAVLGELIERGPGFLPALNERGERLRRRIDSVLRETDAGANVLGQGSVLRFVRSGRGSFAFSGSEFHEFRQALIAEGVYIAETGLSFVSDAHTDDDLDDIVQAVARAAERCSQKREPAPARAEAAPRTGAPRDGALAVSVSFFGMLDSAHGSDFYDRAVRLAETAEEGGLDAVWFPERHFDTFAGFSPNPAILAAMVAGRTSTIGLRAGSAALPLHSPVAVAEEWAMLDVASGGRVGVAVAPGWMRRDFVLSESSYESRRELLEQRVTELVRLWSGEKVWVQGPGGEAADVELFPKPVQAELPLWQATLGSERSFHTAGRAGRNILTNLIQQDLDELEAKLRSYRRGRQEAGLDPDGGEVTVLVHTALTPDAESRERVHRDLERYMLQTFKSTHSDPASVVDSAWSERMESAAARLHDGLSLIGSRTEWLEQCRRLRAAGATELSCLVDFVSEPDSWETTVRALSGLREEVNAFPVPGEAPARREVQARPAPAGTERRVELTRGAVEMWAASKLSPEARKAYTIQRMFEVRGRIDLDGLRDAFLEVLRVDPVLRLRVLPTGEAGAVAEFSDEHRDAFVLYDGVAGSTDTFRERVEADLERFPIDAEDAPGPILRCQRTADGALLHLAASHAVIDGQGFTRILERTGLVYSGEPVRAGAAATQPSDGDEEKDRAHWRRALRGLPPETWERVSTSRDIDRDWRGRRFSRRLPDGWLAALRDTARGHGVTAFVESLASTMRTLDAETGTRLLYAFPAVRGASERFGSNAHLIPVWAEGSPEDLHERCKTAVFGGLAHGSLTFGQIMESAEGGGPARSSAAPDVTFAWDHFQDVRLDDCTIRELPLATEVVRFPLGVTITVGPDGEASFSLDVGEPWTGDGERLFEALYSVLESAYGQAAEPAAPVADPGAVVAAADAMWAGGSEALVDGVRVGDREHPAGLLSGKARATAAAVLERCDVQQLAQVRVSADSEYDLLLCALVCAMCGIADRAVPEEEPAAGNGPVLELRPFSTGAESTESRSVVGLSAWTHIDADVELPSTPSPEPDVAVMIKRLAQSHPDTRLRAVGDAAFRLAALLRPQERHSGGEPVPETAATVRAAWQRALGKNGFGDSDDFFAMGGDSIAAIRVMAEVNTHLGRSLPPTLVYTHPTVSELASELSVS